MNPGVSCQRQQRGKMTNATKVTSVLCRRWRPSRNRIFLRSNLFLQVYQFPTDFDSESMFMLQEISRAIVMITKYDGNILISRARSRIFWACFYEHARVMTQSEEPWWNRAWNHRLNKRFCASHWGGYL